jgi:hypothetical protein
MELNRMEKPSHQNQPKESEKFLASMRKLVSVPKAEIERREKAYQAERKRIKKRKASQ